LEMKKGKENDKQVEKCSHKDCKKEATCLFADGYMNVFKLCQEHFIEKAKEWGMPSAQ